MIDETSQFFAILTNVGAARQANADALGIPWKITHMGVGDANGTDPIPSATQTSLINERRRAPLNQLNVDPNNNAVIVAELVIPEDVGGWWIREIGLYDDSNALVAIANCAPSFKPLLNQGSGRTQVVRVNMIVSNSANVELKIDPSVVLATRAYVDGLTVRASKTEAETGTDPSKIMTPLRVFQAIAKVVAQATEASFGWAKVATQVLIDGGVDDAAFVTSKKLKAAYGIGNSKLITNLDTAPVGFFVAASSATGSPPQSNFYTLGETRGGDSVAVKTQTCMDISTGVTWRRTYGSGAWGAWSSIIDASIQAAEGAVGVARLATVPDVNAGTDHTRIMTPLRVSQAIGNTVKQATETAFGWLKIATTDQVKAGTDNATAVTPAKLREAYGIGNSTLITNLNNASQGFFLAAASATGAPGEVSFYLLGETRMGDSVAVRTQTCMDVSTGRTYRRTYGAGSWGAWGGIVDTSYQATESEIGVMRVATEAGVNGGGDDTTAVTPKKLRLGFSVSLGANGYIVFPSWLGGLVLQYGYVSTGGSSGTVTYPIAFPNAARGGTLQSQYSVGFAGESAFLFKQDAPPTNALSASKTSFNWVTGNSTRTLGLSWLVWGN